MGNYKQFGQLVKQKLAEIDADVLSYNIEEYWMISSVYEYLEFYAYDNELINMAIALPLARGLHDGKYRKSTITRFGQEFRVPYYIHPLIVCKMLADLNVPLSHHDQDILLASALCHDLIEDISFTYGGTELYSQYHLDKEIYTTVKSMSKRYDFTEQEEIDFFHNIASHPLSLLIKLSDRGNNVEDLYNMTEWKIHEYVGETNKFFFPMCEYGLDHYPDLVLSLQVLKDKILTLTEVAEAFISLHAKKEEELTRQLNELKDENIRLKEEWMSMWKEEL